MDESAVRCAVLARALDEPLAGTAPFAPRWVCLEHRGAWPRDVGGHPDPALREFAVRADAAGWRLLLIRRPGRRSEEPGTRVYLADTAPPAPRVMMLVVGGPSELVDVALPVAGPLPGTPVLEPLLMVCTHGRRDRCCALDGRALTQALAAAGEPDVWECSHLGGHRFAPTALVLPSGYLYGRLDVAAAIAARKAAGVGEVEPALCRGRSTWSAPGQVAELAVRRAAGLWEVADVVASAVAPSGSVGRAAEVTAVRVRSRDGREWTVDVEQVPAGPRPTSCGVAPALGSTLRTAGLQLTGP